MNRLAVAVVCVAFSPAAAWAGANCKANPKAEWMSEADARAKIESQGYKITKFKVDGYCYEIYGTDKNGKKVEIYYDTKSLDVVKAEIE
jgi:hypothetical protein